MEPQFKPKRKELRGLDKAESEGCDCDIEEPAYDLETSKEIEEGSEEFFLYLEDPKNHYEDCLYRILCKE